MPILNSKDSIDVPRLLETRLLIQANSGGGKSWALRRILEGTANQCQQLIIDPEGEFSTLREKFDLVICAPHDGDAVANPRTAKLLARRLMENRVSAVIDIYDLKAHERQAFVRIFLETLVNLPKKLWNPAIVVLDEAHVFAPEKGKSESTGAVIDLATRGRKRGLCLAAATQRLAKLHKDVAAELLNKMIGRTGLDIDVRRAGDELGLTHREAMGMLRDLDPGEFYVFGPAISRSVKKIKIGDVQTTHPKVGDRLLSAPPVASTKIKRLLQNLDDLPKQAEEEARSLIDLKRENTQLKRQITLTEKQKTSGGIQEREVLRRINEATGPLQAEVKALQRREAQLSKTINQVRRAIGEPESATHTGTRQPRITLMHSEYNKRQNESAPTNELKLRKGALRILKELAARYPAGYSRSQVGTLTKFAPKGGTFGTYLGDLKRPELIEERDGLMYATETGIEYLGADIPDAPTSHEQAMSQWRQSLRAGAFRMLEAVVEAGPAGIHRDEIASIVGMEATGGTFGTYLGDLRRNGLITESNKIATANDILFP